MEDDPSNTPLEQSEDSGPDVEIGNILTRSIVRQDRQMSILYTC